MLLAMLAIAESHRVQQYVRLVNDADFNSGASASRADGASAKSSARNLELKAILADPRSFSQHMDILLSHMVGNTKSKEEIRTLSGEVEAMMANPLLQEQATLVAQQLEKVMMDADFKKQVEQLLEQAEEFVMQIQTMMTDARLQGEVEWLAHQMEEGMSADGKARDHANTLAKWTELVEKMMANPRLNEHARRLFKQLEAMEANQKFQDQATSFAQLMDTLMADPNFQRHARRIAAHMEAIRSHLTSQNMGGGPTADLFSLAEVDRSSSKVSFVPLRPPARTPFAVASRSAASQGPLANGNMFQSSRYSPAQGTTRAAARSRVLRFLGEADEVEKLQEAAERLRAEVAALEDQRDALKAKASAQTFAAFDTNKDGVVEEEELRAGLSKKFGLEVDDSQMAALMDAFDTNKDGVLELKEFQVDLIRSKVEQLQRAEKELAMEAKRIEMEKQTIMDMFGEENTNNDILTRLLSCLPYFLPLIDSTEYGQFILTQNAPLLGLVLAPFIAVFRAIPFSGLITFFVFSIQSRNRNLPRLLRFNLQQAILLDISLFFPSLFGLAGGVLPPEIRAALTEPACDAVFLTILACIIYSCVGNVLTGKAPNKIPFIGEAADRDTEGPFD